MSTMFERLPIEIIDQILADLWIIDVINLRKCSRIFQPSSERFLYGKPAKLATTMKWACKRGDSEVIRACVAHGASPSYVRASPSEKPMGYAMRHPRVPSEERRIFTLVLVAQKHHDEAFETLIKLGARLDEMTRRDQRFLTRKLSEEEGWRKTRCLLNAGMGQDFVRHPHKCLQAYVKAGAPVDVLQHLVDIGAQLDFVVSDSGKPSKTPLSKAIELNQLEVVKFMLESGANIHQPDEEWSIPQRRVLDYRNYEHIPILAAARAMARTGSTEVMELCLRFGADINYAFYNRQKLAPVTARAAPLERAGRGRPFNHTPLLEYVKAVQRMPSKPEPERRRGLDFFFNNGVKFQIPEMDNSRWAPIPPRNRRVCLKMILLAEDFLGGHGLKFIRGSIYFEALVYVLERRVSLVKA